MGCHGEFQLGRESDCQDIVEIIKQIYNLSSFLEIKQMKLLFLLRKNRVTVGILVLLLLLLLACYQELLVGINISKACTEPQNPS